jgi:hypothetical protein
VASPPLAAEAASLVEKETVPVHGIFKIPNSKHQMPNKSQIRNTNDLKKMPKLKEMPKAL